MIAVSSATRIGCWVLITYPSCPTRMFFVIAAQYPSSTPGFGPTSYPSEWKWCSIVAQPQTPSSSAAWIMSCQPLSVSW